MFLMDQIVLGRSQKLLNVRTRVRAGAKNYMSGPRAGPDI